MKARFFSVLTVICLTTLFFVSNTFAQNSSQWGLPDGAIARFGKGSIEQIAYSPDGSRLAVATQLGIWVYDTQTGRELALLKEHTDTVTSLAYSPDGRTLASGSLDRTILLWDAQTGTRRSTLSPISGVYSLAYSPDGSTLATGGRHGTVQLWDAATGNLRSTHSEHTDSVLSLAFSPDGSTLASSGGDNVILWDAATGSLRNTLGNSSCWTLAFSPDGSTLATGGRHGTVQLWDAATGNLRNTLPHIDIDGSLFVLSLAYSPDGLTLAGGTENNTIGLWDTQTDTLINTLEHRGRVLSLAFSPDSRTLASGVGDISGRIEFLVGVLGDGTVRFWNMATSSVINTLRGHSSGAYSVAYSPDGSTLASGNSDGTVRLWDVATGTLRSQLRGHSSGAYSVAYSPDGTTLASGSGDDTVRLWDVATGTLRSQLRGHSDGVSSVAYSPDGRTLASGRAEVLLWDAATGTLRNVLETDGYVYSLAYSPDRNTLASGGDSGIHLWDAATGNLINTFEGSYDVYSLAYSPDGRTLASGHWRDVHLWNATTGNRIDTFEHPNGIYDVAFGSDGRTLASVGGDKTVRLWDTATGTLRNTLTGHLDSVHSVAFSPDGNTLASGSSDGTVLLWRYTYTPPPTAPLAFDPNTITDQTFTIGAPANLTLPIATGGTPPYTYTTSALPTGLHFDAGTRRLSGTPTTLGTTDVIYTVTDAIGTFAELTFSIEVIEEPPAPGPDPLDVNGDGVVTAFDLVYVALYYGKRGDGLAADVNADGIVNVQDLIAVAAAVDAANPLSQQAIEEVSLAAEQAAELEAIAGAPMGFSMSSPVSRIAYRNVKTALADAKHLAVNDVRLVEKLTVLSEFLQLLTEMHAIPETTALLPNYPNPFNPETWIPYQLGESADVHISIYAADGKLVRTLVFGQQPVGIYASRSRAAYWDGKNALGEPVASGLYFYTLTAGNFTQTRKMLIQK